MKAKRKPKEKVKPVSTQVVKEVKEVKAWWGESWNRGGLK